MPTACRRLAPWPSLSCPTPLVPLLARLLAAVAATAASAVPLLTMIPRRPSRACTSNSTPPGTKSSLGEPVGTVTLRSAEWDQESMLALEDDAFGVPPAAADR